MNDPTLQPENIPNIMSNKALLLLLMYHFKHVLHSFPPIEAKENRYFLKKHLFYSKLNDLKLTHEMKGFHTFEKNAVQ